MTAHERFDRVFADVLADLAQPTYPDYIDDALDVATRKRQRPAWAFPERWLPMTSLTRATPLLPGLPVRRLLAVAVIALLVAALAIVASGALRNAAPPYGLAANGIVAYQVDGDLFARDPVTGETRPLFTADTLDVFPRFSPTGTRFAFFRYAPGSQGKPTDPSSLIVANADGTAARVLAGPAILDWAAWAPSGEAIAVLEKVAGGHRIAILGLDGSRRDIQLDMKVIGGIQWRPPDGGELIFKARQGAVGFFAAKADGSGVRRVPITGTTVTDNGEVALTPDGRSVVYTWLNIPLDIRIADLDTGQVRSFGEGLPLPEGGPGAGPMHRAMLQLSADGTKVVIGRYWGFSPEDNKINQQVWVASLAGDGEDAVAVSPIVRHQDGELAFMVFVSPDGSEIVVHRLETNDTWISDGDGMNRREADWGRLFETDWQRLAP